MAEDATTALVLVHGGGHDARCWELVEAAIAERSDVRTLAIDLPGRGSRPGSLRGLTVAAYVDGVVDQIGEAGLDRVVLVGHSMAGMIVPGVVDALPDGVVAEVVLIAANVAPPGRSVPPRRAHDGRARSRVVRVVLTRARRSGAPGGVLSSG